MTAFWIAAAILSALALVFVLPPLLRRRAAASGEPMTERTLASIYRAQLAELEADRARDLLSAGQYEEARLELERRLLEEVPPADAGEVRTEKPSRAPLLATVLALAIPGASVLGYLVLGNPLALAPPAVARASGSVTPERIEAMVGRLAARLQSAPDDLEGWQMLARSQQVLGRHAEAAKAYERVLALAGPTPDVLVRYAESLARANDGRLEGEPYRRIQQALALEPTHLGALALAGHAEAERGNLAAAADRWQRMMKELPPDSEIAPTVQGLIDDARRRAAAQSR